MTTCGLLSASVLVGNARKNDEFRLLPKCNTPVTRHQTDHSVILVSRTSCWSGRGGIDCVECDQFSRVLHLHYSIDDACVQVKCREFLYLCQIVLRFAMKSLYARPR